MNPSRPEPPEYLAGNIAGWQKEAGGYIEPAERPYVSAWMTRRGAMVTALDPTPNQTEFHLNHGDWIALFSANNLIVERLVELQVPQGATT